MPKIKTKLCQGYLKQQIFKHPAADRDGYVLQHKLVIEDHIKQILPPGCIVHHIDQDRKNNSIDNLLLIPNDSLHMRLHLLKLSKPSDYDKLFMFFLEIQNAVTTGSIDLQKYYREEKIKAQARYRSVSAIPELSEIACEILEGRRIGVQRLREQHGDDVLKQMIRSALLQMPIDAQEYAWELI